MEISNYYAPTQHLSWSSTKRIQKRASPLPRRKTPKNPAPSGELVGLYDCTKKSKNYVELLNKYSEFESLSSADEVTKYLWPQQKDSKIEDQGSTGRHRYSREDYQGIVNHFYKELNLKARSPKDLEFLKLFRRWLKQRAKCNQWFLKKVEY